MSPTPDNWGEAYAKQALADFNAWNELQGNSAIPSCQKLHFLQMACEKLCKAHLCKQPGANPKDFQTSHAYTAKNLGIILRQQLSLVPKPPKNGEFLLAQCARASPGKLSCCIRRWTQMASVPTTANILGNRVDGSTFPQSGHFQL